MRLVLPGDEKKPVAREAAPGTYLTEARIEARVEAGGAERVLVAVVIRKGFRHQVRAHLSHLGFPILGDPLYGVPAPPDTPQRMYLHASGITLAHPFSGEPLRIVSPLPDEFRAAFSGGLGSFLRGRPAASFRKRSPRPASSPRSALRGRCRGAACAGFRHMATYAFVVRA